MSAESIARRLLARHFPKQKVENVIVPKQGMDHWVIIVNGELVFRFPRKAKYKRLFPSETRMMDWLQEKLPLAVPRYTVVDAKRSCGAYPLIPGSRFTPELLASWKAAERDRAAKDLAGFLRALHATPANEARSRFQVPVHVRQRHISQWLRMYGKWVRPHISAGEWSVCERALHSLSKPLFTQAPRVLTHNDLYSHHLLADPKRRRLCGIIDFSDRAIDDPAVDVTKCWEYGREFMFAVHKHYTSDHQDPTMLRRSVALYQRCMMAFVMYAARGKEDMALALPALKKSLRIVLTP